MARRRPALVVIVGPIAAGKSSLAAEVAGQLRERGESVAVVGLDDVAAMALRQLDWSWAHEVLGHLVGAWLATPVRTVIAEGPSSPAEVAQLMRCVSNEVEVLTVVLVTPYEIALRRATSGADRGLSKDPDFLKADHDRFHDGLPGLAPSPSTVRRRRRRSSPDASSRPRRPAGRESGSLTGPST